MTAVPRCRTIGGHPDLNGAISTRLAVIEGGGALVASVSILHAQQCPAWRHPFVGCECGGAAAWEAFAARQGASDPFSGIVAAPAEDVPAAPATPTSSAGDSFEEIQRLTGYQAKVQIRTAWHLHHTPQDARPLAVFRDTDPADPNYERDLPYVVFIKEYAVEAMGATLEEALQQAVVDLRAVFEATS